jgi:hypothetical protein
MRRVAYLYISLCLIGCSPQAASEIEEDDVSEDMSQAVDEALASVETSAERENGLGSGLGRGLSDGLPSGLESPYADDSGSSISTSYGDEYRRPFDEYAARKAAEREVARKGFMGSSSALGCSDDCSGHEAGFEYAQTWGAGIGGSDSRSFDEGRQAYVDEVDKAVERRRNSYDNGDDLADGY